jgi:hypothetical protein
LPFGACGFESRPGYPSPISAGVIAVNPEGDRAARADAIALLVEAGDVYLPGAADADGSDLRPDRDLAVGAGLIDECADFATPPRRPGTLSQPLSRLHGTVVAPVVSDSTVIGLPPRC